jgi:hypothetical protein
MKVRVYVSASLADNSNKANDIATQQLAYILTNYGYNYAKVLGRYNGKPESSFEIVTDDSNVSDIVSIASMFRQACILVDREGYGYLVDCTGKITTDHCIGRRREGTATPDISQDYTFFPETGMYVRYI